MSTPSESFVQVAPDSSGKKIRNLQLTTVDPLTGQVATVQQQVVTITDDKGQILDLDTRPLLQELIAYQQRSTQMLEILAAAFGGGVDNAVVAGLTSIGTRLNQSVSAGSITDAVCDPFGRQIFVPWGSRDLFVSGFSGTITDTTSHALIAAQPDIYLDMLMLIVCNTSASSNSRVDVSDGTNVYPFMSVGGAPPCGFTSPMILPATNKTQGWTITAAAAVTDIRAFALFVRNK